MKSSLNWSRLATLLLAMIAFSGIAQAQTKSAVIGSVASTSDPAVRVDVTELKRIEGGFLSVRLALVNGSNNNVGSFNINEAYLIDNVNKKKYQPVTDSNRNTLSSGAIYNTRPGQIQGAWVRFVAPPDSVQKIAIVLPGFPPSDSMPISQ
jgi:hypothetical protein